MQKICIIFTNVDEKELAVNIANVLISERLAACVNISKVKSFFYWEGVVQNKKEYKLTIKAKEENYKKIEEKILGLHNDELPEIIKIDVNAGYADYLDWVINS